MVDSELPERQNRRRGPGWWMDLDGEWRPPSEWPHDNSPLEGWERGANGRWQPPIGADRGNVVASNQSTTRTRAVEDAGAVKVIEADGTNDNGDDIAGRARDNASAKRRATLLVSGSLGAAAFLLAVALVLITRAGADDVVTTEVRSDVIFAAETESVRNVRRLDAAKVAPEGAATQLAELATSQFDVPPTAYVADDWVVDSETCLDISEQVLIDRSTRDVTWADDLECVPDRGYWVDRNLEIEIDRSSEANVVTHVPPAIVHASGGFAWMPATRDAYLTDTRHPATLQIIARSSGHNPRDQDPSQWRPSSRSIWCAYAVDWIAVKHRWELSVSRSERAALAEMLESCAEPESVGADPKSMLIDETPAPQIERSPTE